jgi:hypothetical protein
MDPMASDPQPKRKVPIHIRFTARAAIVSMTIAIGALVLGNLQLPIAVKVATEFLFWSAGSIGSVALLLWVVFSGLRIAFAKQSEHNVESSGDLW